MLQKLFNLFIGLTLVTGFTISGHAQIQQVNSPYSQLGLGTIQQNTFAVNRALGRSSIAYRSPFNINVTNPASYSAIKLTTFETAVIANGLWLSDANNTQRTGSASLAYLSFAFPIAKYWGSSIGLLPYSTLNYDLTSQVDQGLFDIKYRSIGQGTIYQAYWGNGFSYKGFSAGFNIGYLFGTTNKERRTELLNKDSVIVDVENSFGNLEFEELTVGGFRWDFGLQYEHKIKDNLAVVIGLSGEQVNKVNAENNYTYHRAFITENGGQPFDTLQQRFLGDGKLSLPSKLGIGLSLKKGRDWLITTDVQFEQWEQFKLLETTDNLFTNSMQFGLGFDFIPDTKAITKFWKVANYRLGAFYNTGNIIINDQKITQYGATFGMSVPIRRAASRLNVSMEIGQRGTTDNGLVRETFFNTTFGFTLNDQWFIKRRYD